MKKFKMVLALIILIIFAFSITGCYKTIDTEKGFTLIEQALANSYKEGIYFIKNTYTYENGDIKTDNINVMCDLDKKGYPIKDSLGNYVNLKVRTENKFYKSVTKKTDSISYLSGLSKSTDKATAKEYVFKSTNIDDDDSSIKQAMPLNQFINSDYIKSMNLNYRLEEISTWKKEDIDFNIKKGGIKKTLNTTELIFKLSDLYYEKYFKTYGVESIYKGKYISFELAYDRISNVSVYKEDTTVTFMPYDYESYKLNIVYMSPKFEIYNFDEKNKDGNLLYPDGQIF